MLRYFGFNTSNKLGLAHTKSLKSAKNFPVEL